MGNKLADDIKKVSEGLQKITDDPEGGTLTLEIEGTDKKIVFTMPPKDKRTKLVTKEK